MKLVTYRRNDTAEVLTGVVLDERVLDVSAWIAGRRISHEAAGRQLAAGVAAPAGGILRWLQSGEDKIEALAAHVRQRMDQPGTFFDRLAGVRLAAPVPRPGKIVGVGRNYGDHAKEVGSAPLEHPRLFMKASSSVTAPGAPVPRPAGVTQLDFEAELAVVIGAYAKDVPQAQSLPVVAGYTIVNDVSAREYQFGAALPQTTFAKSMDGFTPMGPWLVTRDEIPDPQALRISCLLNGAPMQDGTTADMLFGVAALVSYCSRFMTLEPGDVITTGTPAGVGAFRQPPVYLQPGDRLRLEISRIGVLEHSVVQQGSCPLFDI